MAFLDQQGLGTELDGVVFPEAGLAVVVLRRRRPLVFDRPDRVALLFEQVELAGDPQALGGERDAAGAQDVAFLARAVGQVGIVDPPVLEQAVLDILVDRHHRLDVFQVVEPRAVADLVQGPDWDQVGGRSLWSSWGLLGLPAVVRRSSWFQPGLAVRGRLSRRWRLRRRVEPGHLLELRGDFGAEVCGLEDDGAGAEAENPALDLDRGRELKLGQQAAVALAVRTWLACQADSRTCARPAAGT